jgi:hypothetical protein
MSEVIFYLLSLSDYYENLEGNSTLLLFNETNFGPVKYKDSLCNVDFLRQQQNLRLCMILNVGTPLPLSFACYMYGIWKCNKRRSGKMKDAECDSDF